MPLEREVLEASILVVDDAEGRLQHLKELLAASGYTRVESAAPTADLLALQERQVHDLILLDLQMPAVDALGVISELKARQPGGVAPVIVLTEQADDRVRALRAGARDYLTKPLDELEVKTRVRQMLEASVLARRLQAQTRELERLVQERTAKLLEGEARYRGLAELASDWYWEQDAHGEFTRLSGPVIEILGSRPGMLDASATADAAEGWDLTQRRALHALIAARRPFLDFSFHRVRPDGTLQEFRMSGEPMLDASCRYIGYRGIGVEVTARR